MLQSRVLKNLVKSLDIIQNINSKDYKYHSGTDLDNMNFVERIEFIILGLKAKEPSFVKLAKNALMNTFEISAIKKLFVSLKNYDKEIAIKYLEKFSSLYNKDLKEELMKILKN